MYITPEQVLANVKGIPNTGESELTTEVIQGFIDDGASDINAKLNNIYVLPLPTLEVGQDDPYPVARASLKTLLLYYCLVRVELFMNIQSDMEQMQMQSVTNRAVYKKMYDEKLMKIMTLKEPLPDVPVRSVVQSSFPPAGYNDINQGHNW